MAVRNDNMNQVEDWGALLPEGQWFHVRVSKVQDQDDKGNDLLSEESNQPICKIWMKVQDEPFVGRVAFDMPSLQAHALAKMKSYYKAAGQGILPDGRHDPQLLVDTEFYIKGTHEVYKNEKRFKIAPFHIKSLEEGRPAA